MGLFGYGDDRPMYPGMPIGFIHSFYLLGEIGDASEYSDWFNVMRVAQPNDLIRIHINSPGGDLFTMLQMMTAIRESKAQVHVSVEGYCASAATIPMMYADHVLIGNHCVFMFHNYSGGVFGKGGEQFDQVTHMRAWSEELLNEIYAHFMTPEEIQAMLDNKDYYMHGPEVAERINRRAEALMAEYEVAESEDEESEGEEIKQSVLESLSVMEALTKDSADVENGKFVPKPDTTCLVRPKDQRTLWMEYDIWSVKDGWITARQVNERFAAEPKLMWHEDYNFKEIRSSDSELDEIVNQSNDTGSYDETSEKEDK